MKQLDVYIARNVVLATLAGGDGHCRSGCHFRIGR